MLNSRRALVAALSILAIFFLITRSQVSSSADPSTPSSHDTSATADSLHDGTSSGYSDGRTTDENDGRPPLNPEAAAAAAGGAGGAGGAAPARNTPVYQQKQQPLQRTPRKPTSDMSHLSTADKLAYVYPYDVTSKFPAYIWQTWKWTADDAEFEYVEQEASWTQQHPTFIHEVVTDHVAVKLLRLLYASVPEVLEAYEALPRPVLKADFFRYLILYARGGIYSDIDTFAIQSAVNWLPPDVALDTVGLVVGIEADPDRPDWADWYSRRIQFCQWTIQAKPGHPALRAVIAHITRETLERKRSGKLASFVDSDTVNLTGPAVWTDVIMDYLNDERYFDRSRSSGVIDYRAFTGMEDRKRIGDVVVLPITSFSPGVGQMGAKEDDDPMAFVKHYFEGTWKPESERHIGEQRS